MTNKNYNDEIIIWKGILPDLKVVQTDILSYCKWFGTGKIIWDWK